MPWSNQNGGGRPGGPWGGGGGPWGSGPQNNGPWGGGPNRPGGPSGGGAPDLEELFKRTQERLRRMMSGGGPQFGGVGLRGALIAIAAVVVIYLFTGFYRVQPGEVGVELVLGRYQGMTQPGLNYNWPYPIGAVYTPDVLRVREMTIGSRDLTGGVGGVREVPEESLMLTGDENIVDVDFRVQWRINDAPKYLFNIENPEGTVKQVAESAMREVIGQRNIQPILTQQRTNIEVEVQKLMQQILNRYTAGIEVTQVQMQKVDPPKEVIAAFRDVQAAKADQERLQNEAEAYANRIVPGARGQASQIIQAANAYRDRVIAEARGQADRFIKVYDQYVKAPQVTRERIYLETMENVLGGTNKVIIGDRASGTGVVPYLPLDRLEGSRPQGAASSPTSAPPASPATGASLTQAGAQQ